MSSISVSTEQKAEFDDRFPDKSHKEAMQELLDAHKRDNGQVVDPEAIADEIKHSVAADIEQSVYRGVREAIKKLARE